MKTVPQILIFLASPGDVNEERVVALEVLDMLEYDPLFKRNGAGGVSIHAIAQAAGQVLRAVLSTTIRTTIATIMVCGWCWLPLLEISELCSAVGASLKAVEPQ